MSLDELDFSKSCFKCKVCLSERRLSGAALGVDLVEPLNLDEKNLSDVAVLVENSVNMPVCTVPAITRPVVASIAVQTEPVVVTLDMLYAKLMSLEESNNGLRVLVSALSKDKAVLIKKLNSVQMQLSELQGSLQNVPYSSPKRKKQKAKLTSSLSCVNKNNAETGSGAVVGADISTVSACNVNDVVSVTGQSAVTSQNSDGNYLNVISDGNYFNANTKSTFASIIKSSTGQTTSITADDDLEPAVADSYIWKRVPSKKKNKIVVGVNANDGLGVFVQRKWLHLSSFKPTTTVESLVAYVSKHTGVPEVDLVCSPLVKRGTDLQTCKFVNFKLGIPDHLYDKILVPSLWPANIKVRPFLYRAKEAPVVEVTHQSV